MEPLKPADVSKKIIGMTEDAARAYLLLEGYVLRVMNPGDGGTCDFNNSRVNVTTERGIVTSVLRIG